MADHKAPASMPAPGMMIRHSGLPDNPYAHGVATLMGIEVDAYFEPGGIRMLLNDDRYHSIVQAIEKG